MSQEPTGVLVRALLDEGAVRLVLVEATAPARHTRTAHKLSADAARLGAEAVVAAALNAAHIKGEEQLTLQLQAESPKASFYADIVADGALRVRVTPPDLTLEGGRLTGQLLVIKSLGRQELYRGISAVPDSTIEQALATHLETSAQVHDVLRIGVRQSADGEILQAGGLLIERLPEEPDHPSLSAEEFEQRYAWVREADIAKLLTQLAFGSLGEQALKVLDSRPLVWRCRCSRERVEAILAGLGIGELSDMAQTDGQAEVSCDFCNTTYRFDEADLNGLIASLRQS
ncbi:MAG: Hsp33 family molecular chaperone HslO [Myxococcota bacterium]